MNSHSRLRLVRSPSSASLPSGLSIDPDASSYAGDRSGRRGASPFGAVRVASMDGLRSLVRWANNEAMPLVPVSSRGGPRRRGDTVSPSPAMIVDLSGMTRVIHADGRDAVAVIEAGVTFDELDDLLEGHGLKSYRPLLPRASKSVMAAFLEREPITVPGHHWDSADPLAAMELVFGNGDAFRTGGAALPGTIEENLKRGNRPLYNFGPGQTDFGRMIQGAQGALGIVARCSILCRRLPALSVPWFVSADTLAPVVATAYALLRQRPDGDLFIVNAMQLALMLGADAASVATLREQLPAWSMYVELTAPAMFPSEAMAYRTADLRDAALGAGAYPSEEAGGQAAAALAAGLTRSTATPYKDRAGHAWEEVFFLSQLSRAQAHLETLFGLAKTADVAVYLQPMTQGVNAHCELTFFGRDQASVTALARGAALRLAESGAFYSRPYHLWADLAFARDRQIAALLKKTKDLFDPNGILQPQSQALGLSGPYVASHA